MWRAWSDMHQQHSSCWEKARVLDSSGEGRKKSARVRTDTHTKHCWILYVIQRQERNIAYVRRARQKNVLTTSSRGSETENSCGTLLCAPNRHSYLYFGSQHCHSTCKIAWSLRSQQTGEEGKETVAYRPATADEWPPFAPGSSDSDRRRPQGGTPSGRSVDDL